MAQPRGWKSGAIIADRYELETLLGSGGMGFVWRAFDRKEQRPVALKRLKPELGRGVGRTRNGGPRGPGRPPERLPGVRDRLEAAVISMELLADNLRNHLLSSAHESTSIIGERRIGKTSFLYHLSSPEVSAGLGLTSDKFCLVYVHFQGLSDIEDAPLRGERRVGGRAPRQPVRPRADPTGERATADAEAGDRAE